MKEIRPEGWLRQQLQIQAAGLTGNLDKFWPDIKDSKWIGGTTDSWERMPYWLDGFIPLAWLLDDEEMKSRANKYMNHIIEHQAPDGWLCPDPDADRSKYDLWALFLILKVMVVYHDFTEDDRIGNVVWKALKYLDRHIDGTTLFNWAQFRWFECLIPIYWLYEKKPEEWLLKLVTKLQCQGFDWLSFFKCWPYKESDGKGRWSLMSHVVNNAMALKSGPLLWRMTGMEEHKNGAEQMADMLDRYHGMVTGVFSGDECLAGVSPVSGTELCAVAEYMYSLEHILSITGEARWGDRLEMIAYNALPATMSPDMWSHQYDQQVNQIECSQQADPIYTTNRGDANIFGLEPNFGCCTSNLHQAWPKLALSTFMRTPDGLAASVYAPSTVDTVINDAHVTITLDTDYPFRQQLRFKVKTDKKVSFALWLRIPEWAEGAWLEKPEGSLPVSKGGFHRLDRVWEGETILTLNLPSRILLKPRPGNMYAVVRGPLVYSLAIGERWERIDSELPYHEAPHCDYEVYPTTPWNYALCLSKDHLEKEAEFMEYPVTKIPFSPDGAPVCVKVHGKRIDWPLIQGSAAPYPPMTGISDTVEELRLIPYGCTNLRLTEMPLLQGT